ncbi:MAG TPA: hypothetical protein VJ596_02580, partial [Gemmatimonadaceae bacterium]|nr:hypothetical protein [Gemmatimonadaceae bacterium]
MLAPRYAALFAATLTIVVPAAISPSAAAQAPDSSQRLARVSDSTSAEQKEPRPPTRFYDTNDVLAVTLTTNLRELRRDKMEDAPWRPATFSYTAADGKAMVVPAQVRTRGIWRLKNCAFPPLRVNFGRDARESVFDRLDKPKLVNFCRDNDQYEQYILQEFQLYRIYALLTPLSHRTRLLRTTYTDSATGEVHATRYAILLEEPQELAKRMGMKMLEIQGAKAQDLEPYHAALVGVFQYLIGNSDWSARALHNAELMQDSASLYYVVPYDFDFSGAVNARYATPPPQLPIRSVRQRIYRGHCAPAAEYAKVFALFKEKKDAIYALYRDPIGQLLNEQTRKQTLEYFDDFYEVIESPGVAQREIVGA